MTTYATASDYATYKGLPYPGEWDADEIARINAGLLNAQDDIDAVIRMSVYDAEDTEVQSTLTRATCARFDYAETTGDDGTGASRMFDSVGIGSVRLSRNNDADSSRDVIVEKLGEKAATILYNGGLITRVVYHS